MRPHLRLACALAVNVDVQLTTLDGHVVVDVGRCDVEIVIAVIVVVAMVTVVPTLTFIIIITVIAVIVTGQRGRSRELDTAQVQRVGDKAACLQHTRCFVASHAKVHESVYAVDRQRLLKHKGVPACNKGSSGAAAIAPQDVIAACALQHVIATAAIEGLGKAFAGNAVVTGQAINQQQVGFNDIGLGAGKRFGG